MGTTLTALVVMRADESSVARFALVNVGDSRTYLLRNMVLHRATVDHSYVQELVNTGHISEDEARTHPRRNIVTRALGIEPTVRVDTWLVPMVHGDRFILCSDGLVDEVHDDDIAAIALATDDPQVVADLLVAKANANGGRDNVTVVVVDVLQGVEPTTADTGARIRAGLAGFRLDVDDDRRRRRQHPHSCRAQRRPRRTEDFRSPSSPNPVTRSRQVDGGRSASSNCWALRPCSPSSSR